MILPLDPEIKAKWDEFLEFLYTEKHLARQTWMPCYMSIKLWLEFEKWRKKK